MLQVVDFTERDRFGNDPPEGGVLVVGVKYTLSIGPMNRVEDDFRLWVWRLYTSGSQLFRRELVQAPDPVMVPEEELQARAVLMAAKDAAGQLAFHATFTHQQALDREVNCGADRERAEARVSSYPHVREAHEIAEWAEGVEHYLWFQRWLVGAL